MEGQLRRYRTRPGAASTFAEEWAARVAPLRRRFGFRVQGWVVDGTDVFVWVIEHDDRASFAAAEAAYYASPERVAMEPDPARWVIETQVEWVTPAGGSPDPETAP